MKIGMNIPVMVPGLDRNTILQWARKVDVGPYSSLAAGERITFPNPELMVTMGAAAAATERVRLALTVVVLPMHSPVLVAKQVATLDVISGGRVTLGLGIGARPEDYRAVGATFDARRLRRMEGQIALMRRIWAGENVIEGAERLVEPLPVQPGGPELLAGALAPDSVRRAARWADGICGFSFGPSAEEIGSAFDTARQSWTEAGRAKPPRLVTSFWFALGSRAREQLDEYLTRYLAFMGQELAAALLPMVTTTSAATLRDATRMVEDLGADELILVPTTLDPEEVDRVADILG
jgi:alkanesulfonate monooxygenase SsuD/methylene tetrahydromethanopterin reductase-like flavin-dependent oxidoreductase (luciferase family)